MSRKAQGPTTVKKNIKKESMHYFIRHKTIRFIQALAEKDQRTVGTYLDVIAEREAREHLTADEVAQIIRESEQKEAERLAEAEQMLQQRAETAEE